MANKTYTVMKDGEEMKELKTLAAAKKLADAEDAEVFCEGLCVYQGTVKDSEDTVSKTAEIAGIAQKGTIVDVTAIEGDWMHLADGSYILFEGGKFAVKN